MVRGITESGFEYELEDGVLDDYELLETLCAIDKGDYSNITTMVDTLLGTKQREALKAHLRAETGRVSAKAVLKEVMEIFRNTKQGKNS